MSCEFQFCQLVIVDGMESIVASIHFPVVHDLQGYFVMHPIFDILNFCKISSFCSNIVDGT